MKFKMLPYDCVLHFVGGIPYLRDRNYSYNEIGGNAI